MPSQDTRLIGQFLRPHGEPTEIRFWSNVLCDIGSGCWLWQGNRGWGRQARTGGYGALYISRQYRVLEETSTGWIMQITRSRVMAAHRYSWELLVGPIPDGLILCHHCDTPLCVRPEHLFVGTHADNIRDMFAKGRNGDPTNKTRVSGLAWQARYGSRTHNYPRGEAHGRSILTEADVRDIKTRRRNGELLRVLAAEYGVHLSLIGKIMAGKNWAHID